jgi:hypothetical protein
MNSYWKEFFNNVKDVLYDPALFWKKKEAFPITGIQLLAGYLIPLILFAALGVFAGEMFRGLRFYLFFSVMKAIRKIVLLGSYYFISVYIINALMPVFGIKKDLQAALYLAAFSLTPLMVITFITGLFPFLYILNILGIYGLYILWRGINILLDFRDDKQYSYFLMIIIVVLLVYSLLSVILSKLFTAII